MNGCSRDSSASTIKTADARLHAAEQRDAIADARDVAALARDQAAGAGDVAVAEAGLVDEQAEGARARTGADMVVRAAGQCRRAAQQRAKAAEHREMAAEDRLMAERDRGQGVRERRRSLLDREMLVRQIEREYALRGEALGHQHRADRLARTLQRSLSPPSLPIVAELDVAVHYEPSAPGDVGGDFHDLFPLAAGRSGFFLGGVSARAPRRPRSPRSPATRSAPAAMLREEPDALERVRV